MILEQYADNKILYTQHTGISNLISHSTYSWYRQFERTQQVPKHKAWAQLDRKIGSQGNGTGLALLSIFKLADIDGHENISDVYWFIEKANQNFLSDLGKALPALSKEALESLRS